jgi:hypothetical protein
VYTTCGNALNTAGDPLRAKARYETAVAFLPEDHTRTENAQSGLAIALSRLGETEQCARVRRGLVEKNPESWFAHYNLSVTLNVIARTTDQMDEAIAHAQVANDLMESSNELKDADVPAQLGALLLNKGEILGTVGCGDTVDVQTISRLHSDGCTALQAALAIDPHHPAASARLGRAQTGKDAATSATQPKLKKAVNLVGAAVCLHGLKSVEYNGRVGIIERGVLDERITVALQETETEIASSIKVKPMHLVPTCNNCFTQDSDLTKCSGCYVTMYCDKECQKIHWKGGHRNECAELKSRNESNWKSRAADDKSSRIDHPSWKRLDKLQRQHMRDKHTRDGCVVPWPIACETPAMMQASSFLRVHPAMRFQVKVAQSASYQRPGDVSASHRGPPAPTSLFVLRENPGEDYSVVNGKLNAAGKRYHTRVPAHLPSPMMFCVIGEVTWTTKSKFVMDQYYHPDGVNKGKHCQWPGGNAVAVCPATGVIVQPDTEERYLLVAQRLQGMCEKDSHINLVDRIMPRILTLPGYDKIMENDPRSRGVRTMKTTGQGQQVESHLEFSPHIVRTLSECIRSMAMRDVDVQASMAFEINEKFPVPAHIAWEVWTGSGQYEVFDRFLNDNKTIQKFSQRPQD